MTALSHNLSESSRWLSSKGIVYTQKPIHEQVECIQINHKAINQFGYNPSIIKSGSSILMPYRWHHAGNWMTSLSMAELNDKFQVTNNLKIDITAPSAEDPRLFIRNGESWMSYTHATHHDKYPKCAIRYGKLVSGKMWTVAGQWLPAYGKNDGTAIEKNWQPFEHEGSLFFIYSSEPHTVIRVHEEKILEEFKGNEALWPWGMIKGGSVPIPYQGYLLRFFHSRLDNEPPPLFFRYYVGAMLMKNYPPFEVVKISREPILIGSEADEFDAATMTQCVHRKANVVFPGGAIEIDGGWLLAVGVNDCACVLAKIKPDDLKL